MSRVAIVTGAASGIGAETARRLARHGWYLGLHTREREREVLAVARECEGSGAKVVVVTGDFADRSVSGKIVGTTVDAFGRLDAIVVNAGSAKAASFITHSDDDFRFIMDIHLGQLVGLVRAALPHLKNASNGRIVGVSSFVARRQLASESIFPASTASKAAMEALGCSLAREFAVENITVNFVAPGYVLKDPGASTALSFEQWESVAERIPMKRLGKPEDIARAIEFFLEEGNGYITGQVLAVDGGLSL